MAQPYIAELEKRDLRGDRALVRGTQTGSARVMAKPQDPAYKVHAISIKVSLYIKIYLKYLGIL